MRRVAVVGAGLTRFMRRAQESGTELSWLAASQALASCGLGLKDVDCVAIGSAPDAFDGVHMKGEDLAPRAGGWGRPGARPHAGGGTRAPVPLHPRFPPA